MKYNPLRISDEEHAYAVKLQKHCMLMPVEIRAAHILETIFDDTPLPTDDPLRQPHLIFDRSEITAPWFKHAHLFETCYTRAPDAVERGKAVSIFQTRINDVVALLGQLIVDLKEDDYPRAVRIMYCLDFLNKMITFPSCRRKMHRNKSMPKIIKQCICLKIHSHSNFFHLPRVAVQIAWGVTYLMTKYITCGEEMVNLIESYTSDYFGLAPAGVNRQGQKYGFVVARIEAYADVIKNSKKLIKKKSKKDPGMGSTDGIVYVPIEYRNTKDGKMNHFLDGGIANADELHGYMWKMLVSLQRATDPEGIQVKKSMDDDCRARGEGSFVEHMYQTMKVALRNENQKTTVVTATMCEASNCNQIESDNMMDEGVVENNESESVRMEHFGSSSATGSAKRSGGSSMKKTTFKKCSRCGVKYCSAGKTRRCSAKCRSIIICSFLFYCRVYYHSFQTNPNSITNLSLNWFSSILQ